MDMMLWLIMIAVVLFLYMLCIEPNRLKVRHIQVDGDVKRELCIVHFTDTHFHRHFSRRYLRKLIDAINAENADLIVFSGDLMDRYETSPTLAQELPPYLAMLHARLGKVAVYGNHDIGGKAKDVYPEMMKKAGFQILCNNAVCYEEVGLAVFGTDDMLAGFEDRNLSAQCLQPYQILIAHEPDLIDDMDMRTIDLMLSGHTHGGQIYLPIITSYILPKGGRKYRKGAYQKDNTILYVSGGIGMSTLPLRFANTPEIVVYHVRNKKQTTKSN